MSYCQRKSSKTNINVPSGALSSLQCATSYSTTSKKTPLPVAKVNVERETAEMPSNELFEVDIVQADATQVQSAAKPRIRTRVQSFMVDDATDAEMMAVSNNNGDE